MEVHRRLKHADSHTLTTRRAARATPHQVPRFATRTDVRQAAVHTHASQRNPDTHVC